MRQPGNYHSLNKCGSVSVHGRGPEGLVSGATIYSLLMRIPAVLITAAYWSVSLNTAQAHTHTHTSGHL